MFVFQSKFVKKFKKKSILFFFITLTLQGFSQNTPISLRQYIETIEQSYPVLFSFQDALLATHVIVPDTKKSLEASIAYLIEKTVFTYTKVDASTYTISLAPGVVSLCYKALKADEGTVLSDAFFETNYQKGLTNENGIFLVYSKKPNEKLKINHPSVEQTTLLISNSIQKECTPLFLLPVVNTLSPVEISNYVAKGISKNKDGSITVDYDNFEVLPGLIENDALQTIKALPGIQSVDETVSRINIRGGTNDQNYILYDGIKMYKSGHFFGLISAFNPSITKKVTIYKNGTSALYGDGVSGVIAIEGSDAVSTKIQSSAGINLLNVEAFTDIPIHNKMSLQLAGRKSINNLVRTPTYEAYFDKAFQNTELTNEAPRFTTSDDAFSFYDINARWLYRPSNKDFIRATTLVTGNQLNFLENSSLGFVNFSRESGLQQTNYAAGIQYIREWSPTLTTQAQLYGSNYTLEAINEDIANNQQLLQTNEILESGIKLDATYRLNNQTSFRGGYQFNETGIVNATAINFPFFRRRAKQVLRTQSVFSEMSYQNKDKGWNVVAGVRGNYISKFEEFLIEPRLHVSKQFLKDFTFEVAGELKSQTTSQVVDLQEDFLGVENRKWILSNPDDTPIIQSQQLSAGFTYAKNGWLVTVEGFSKQVDGITSQSQGFQNQFENERTTGSFHINGIEVLLNKRYKKITTWLSYTYADNVYTFEDFTPQHFPNNIDITHNITYGITYLLNNWKLSTGFNWRTGKPNTLATEGVENEQPIIQFQTPNASNISDYLRIDVSALYDFKVSQGIRGQAGASIWNLTNRNNITHHFYRINEADAFEEVAENALRFTPNATVRLFF